MLGTVIAFLRVPEPEVRYSRNLSADARAVLVNARLTTWDKCLREDQHTVLRRVSVLSLLAIENYARPSLWRKVEFQYAKLVLFISGELPDISLGIAQIKPRHLVGNVEPWQKLALLADDCYSARLSAELFMRLEAESSRPYEVYAGISAVDSLAVRRQVRVYDEVKQFLTSLPRFGMIEVET